MENIFREYKIKVEFEKRSRLDFPPHLHDDVEIVYVIRGNGEAFCAGKKYMKKYYLLFFRYLSFLYVHFFLFDSCTQRERNEPKKEKQRLLKELVYSLYENFSAQD